MELPKHYNPKEEEPKWQKFWHDNKLFSFDPKSKGEHFIIDTPPPTVSGRMHIGHAFSYTQEDFVARYKRMKGFNVYYPFGTDDNGLPTERLVEKLKKVKSTRMKRPDFVKLCRETIKEVKPDFVSDWVKIGMSCDFSKPYSTIDPHCVKTSQKSFVDLFKKGLVERQDAPTMWCVNCQTAIAQAELEDNELSSSFSDITFKTEDGKDITIATTRPELLPACVCVFVHPDDKRYKDLVGKKAVVPLFGQEVPIFADESADPEKGSGILMICSYGDRFDVDAINRRKLEPRVCINKDGTMNSLAKQFEGMKVAEARKVILEELEKKNLLTAKKDISHPVNVHDKCGTEIEFLATKQWFIKILDNKDKFLEAGNKINWYPKSMKVRYDNWVKNLNWDWGISRQRHFGAPFPVWYDKKTGEAIVADESELPVDPLSQPPKGYKSEDVEPEMDVMDTWATSSMTPYIISNWVGDKDFGIDFKDSFPATLRPQAHDIIRTWAFYTIVKSIYHNGTIPWKDIMISGNVSDPKGEKMSKSKGNVVDPNKVIDQYSSDALRYWAAASNLGADLAYQEKDLATGQKTVTKIWNASKFAIMHLEDYDLKEHDDLHVIDRWILSKMNRLIKNATANFDVYEYSKVKSETEIFFWQVLCNNYLEIVKNRLYNPDERGAESRKSAQFALYNSVLTVLKLMAPLMPHITEAVYQLYFAKKEGKKSIHVSDWPSFDEKFIDDESELAGDLLVDVLSTVRKFRSKQAISLKEIIKKLVIICEDKKHEELIKKGIDDLKPVANVENIEFEGAADIDCENFKIKVGIVRS